MKHLPKASVGPLVGLAVSETISGTLSGGLAGATAGVLAGVGGNLLTTPADSEGESLLPLSGTAGASQCGEWDFG